MKTIIFLFILLFSSSSFAQQQDSYDIDLDTVPIREFVKVYSSLSGRSVIVHPDVYGYVSVYNASVPYDQLDTFFVDLLNTHGFNVSGDSPLLVDSDVGGNFNNVNEPIVQDNDINIPSLNNVYNGFTNEIDVPLPDLFTQTYTFSNVRASDLMDVVSHVATSNLDASFSSNAVVLLNASNSLVVKSTQENLDFIASILPDLDISQPQVFIRAMFYETTEDSAFDLGLGYGSSSGSDTVGGFNTASLGRSLASVGGSFGIYNGDVLGLALQAIQRDSTARLLSTPHILTMSGTKGRINVGQVVPVVTGRVTGEAASIDSPFQTIERISVGLGLTVVPVVLSGGRMVLDVVATADSVSEASFASDVVTNERQLSTSVQLRPGQTLALGGLISDNQREATTSVPVLGDLPLFGSLFRSKSTTNERSVLNILLTAEIIE
jgi:general secretion pathway protein D